MSIVKMFLMTNRKLGLPIKIVCNCKCSNYFDKYLIMLFQGFQYQVEKTILVNTCPKLVIN